jgi:hypothetical protein
MLVICDEKWLLITENAFVDTSGMWQWVSLWVSQILVASYRLGGTHVSVNNVN